MYRKFFEETSLPRILCWEIRTENIRRVIPVQPNFEEKLLPTNSWRENCLPRIFWREITAKKVCDKVLCQRISKETFPAKSLERGISTKKNQNIFGKISLTIFLPRTLWRETYTKQISAVTSTEKYWNKKSTTNSQKRNLYETIFNRNPYKKNSQEKIYKTNI